MIKIGIVILNYNLYQDTIKLVNALHKQTVAQLIHIVIVDNASPNHSFKFLKPLEQLYNNVTILQTGENLGYAKGNNEGLHFLDKYIHPEYVAVINNDIILQKTSLEQLLDKYKQLEDPAIIAPKQLDVEQNEVPVFNLNSFFDDCLNLFYLFKLFYHNRKIKPFKDDTGKNAMKIDLVPGSFMFSSFKTFKKMGFFYPNTFLFAEERFIAMKAKALNLKNYILLDETYIHFHSKTINTQHSKISKYNLMYASWLEFTKVHRKNPNFKIWILKNLMNLSILEMHFFHKVKIVFKKL